MGAKNQARHNTKYVAAQSDFPVICVSVNLCLPLNDIIFYGVVPDDEGEKKTAVNAQKYKRILQTAIANYSIPMDTLANAVESVQRLTSEIANTCNRTGCVNPFVSVLPEPDRKSTRLNSSH